MTIEQFTFVFRRGTAAAWAASTRVLREGEPGFETDTNIFKIGDGVHMWKDLVAIGGATDGSSDAAVLAHINSLTPHPVYDDGPSLQLLYENAKVG